MKDKLSTYESIQDNRIFRIEEDYPEVGAYLYVYENGRCIYDYLQDSTEMCKAFALEEFNVPIDSWVGDIAAANRAAGHSRTPAGYTWHHHQQSGRMQLVERNIHAQTGHTGGFSLNP